MIYGLSWPFLHEPHSGLACTVMVDAKTLKPWMRLRGAITRSWALRPLRFLNYVEKLQGSAMPLAMTFSILQYLYGRNTVVEAGTTAQRLTHGSTWLNAVIKLIFRKWPCQKTSMLMKALTKCFGGFCSVRSTFHSLARGHFCYRTPPVALRSNSTASR